MFSVQILGTKRSLEHHETPLQEVQAYETIKVLNDEPLREEPAAEAPDAAAPEDNVDDAEEGPDEPEGPEDEVIDIWTATSFYNAFVKIDKASRDKEAQAAQRSPEWLQARKYCLTASSFGAAAGHNAYQSPQALLVDKLWGTFKGNAATAYGSFHEADAEARFMKWATKSDPSTSLTTTGLLKCLEKPWLGVSPDGLLWRQLLEAHEPINLVWRGTGANRTLELIEYKCPAYKKYTEDHPYSKYKHNVPDYYYDQVQGIMGLLNDHLDDDFGCPELAGRPKITAAWFVVWQPNQTFITRCPFDADYWTKDLLPALSNWWFGQYLPALVHKENGLLTFGETKPTSVLEL